MLPKIESIHPVFNETDYNAALAQLNTLRAEAGSLTSITDAEKHGLTNLLDIQERRVRSVYERHTKRIKDAEEDERLRKLSDETIARLKALATKNGLEAEGTPASTGETVEDGWASFLDYERRRQEAEAQARAAALEAVKKWKHTVASKPSFRGTTVASEQRSALLKLLEGLDEPQKPTSHTPATDADLDSLLAFLGVDIGESVASEKLRFVTLYLSWSKCTRVDPTISHLHGQFEEAVKSVVGYIREHRENEPEKMKEWTESLRRAKSLETPNCGEIYTNLHNLLSDPHQSFVTADLAKEYLGIMKLQALSMYTGAIAKFRACAKQGTSEEAFVKIEKVKNLLESNQNLDAVQSGIVLEADADIAKQIFGNERICSVEEKVLYASQANSLKDVLKALQKPKETVATK